ncbi:MAG: dipeptidase [Candidatus Dormibacteria bacterium]
MKEVEGQDVVEPHTLNEHSWRHEIDVYVDVHHGRMFRELADWCAIPTISSQHAHEDDVRKGAQFALDALRTRGCDHGELLETAGHPVVYARFGNDKSRSTVLVYGHYDVQPVDPIDEWTTPPFVPTTRNGALYARGAVDDKGQVWAHLAAFEALMATGGCPVNLIFLLEGEEEIGSPHFHEAVEAKKHELQCDVAVISDTTMTDPQHPAICTHLRGIVALECHVSGPAADLHSGEFGGIVANPAEVLARILAGLKDPVTGHVLVPGFYDDVQRLTDLDRRTLAEVPFDEEGMRLHAGVETFVGDPQYSVVERLWAQPTLEINGVTSGYQGEGSKTIIPKDASAKITCRLVPNQEPMTIGKRVADYCESLAPAGVHVEAVVGSGGNPVVAPLDSPYVQASADALEEVFQVRPSFIREGGSIPPADLLQTVLGIPVILVGFGIQEENYHAPNEHFHETSFMQAVRVIARMMHAFAAIPRSQRSEP